MQGRLDLGRGLPSSMRTSCLSVPDHKLFEGSLLPPQELGSGLVHTTPSHLNRISEFSVYFLLEKFIQKQEQCNRLLVTV